MDSMAFDSSDQVLDNNGQQTQHLSTLSQCVSPPYPLGVGMGVGTETISKSVHMLQYAADFS